MIPEELLERFRTLSLERIGRVEAMWNGLVQNIDAARDSVSGVNLDEEMTSMLQFQHAYDAAARFLTAVDQTLDTLINQTPRTSTQTLARFKAYGVNRNRTTG